MTLEQKLAALLNSENVENESDTPDWILAQYMLSCLAAFTHIVRKRDAWYGFKPRPTDRGAP